MSGINDLRKVAWRRVPAPQHYVGYLAVADRNIRLAGHDASTGIEISLSIPFAAMAAVRASVGSEEEVVGERAVVIDLGEGPPILIRPVGRSDLHVDALQRRLGNAFAAPTGAAP
jgi:hypothetical protein